MLFPSSAAFVAASAASRITVSIVPSTGFGTAPYASSAAMVRPRAKFFGFTSSASVMASRSPRKSCAMMSPLFPLAPSRAARAIAADVAGTSALAVVSMSEAIPAHRQRHVGSGVAVRNGKNVQRIELVLVCGRWRRVRLWRGLAVGSRCWFWLPKTFMVPSFRCWSTTRRLLSALWMSAMLS